MEKYYYERSNQGFPTHKKCYFLDRELLSTECRTCDNFRGFDKEENWIKCLLYDANLIMLEQTQKIERIKKNLSDREDRIDFLNKKIIEAYSTLDDYRESFGELNSNGGY